MRAKIETNVEKTVARGTDIDVITEWIAARARSLDALKSSRKH